MVTKSTEYNYKDCEKIDGRKVNAYVDAHLNEENPVELDIESTWGDSAVDLTKAVKAAETVTHMELGSNAIEYFAEDGHVDCIYGDDLSRIISMQLLKDVDITTPPRDGDVYMYDENKGKFVTFNLKEYMDNIEQIINNLTGQINNVKNTITRPAGIPENTTLTWGNINLISDHTNTNQRTRGLFTHNTSIDEVDDEFFA
jgi:hypothetical protein